MPFKSKAQQRWMFAAEDRGEVPKGTAERWAKHTPDIKALPERKKSASAIAMHILQKVSESMEVAEEREEARMNPVTIEEVRAFLRGNPAPEDYELHQWAQSKGVSPHSAEELIYQLAAQQVTGKKPEETVEGGSEEKEGSYLKWAKEYIEGGKAEGKPSSAFPSKQLQMGIKVEKEHTPNPEMAREIAKDHLEEFSNYYTALDRMEKKLEQQKEATRKQQSKPLGLRGLGVYHLLNGRKKGASVMKKTAEQIANEVLWKVAQGVTPAPGVGGGAGGGRAAQVAMMKQRMAQQRQQTQQRTMQGALSAMGGPPKPVPSGLTGGR